MTLDCVSSNLKLLQALILIFTFKYVKFAFLLQSNAIILIFHQQYQLIVHFEDCSHNIELVFVCLLACILMRIIQMCSGLPGQCRSETYSRTMGTDWNMEGIF